MTYQTKYKKASGGFSIIEILVVLGIFAILFAISTSVYGSLKVQNNLSMALGSTVEALRYAENKARAGEQDSSWGVKIATNQITVFSGTNFAGRNSDNDQTVNFPGGVSASGISEIVFDKITGKTNNIGTVTFASNASTKSFSLNSYGTIHY
jgi:prepilin-type N-terminal cleavage/methylation domain-containing protein